jgi:hypothetical protein
MIIEWSRMHNGIRIGGAYAPEKIGTRRTPECLCRLLFVIVLNGGTPWSGMVGEFPSESFGWYRLIDASDHLLF